LRVIGALSDLYVFVSDFRVTPWIAVREVRPTLIPQEAEVEQVIEIPLRALADPQRRVRHSIERGRKSTWTFRRGYLIQCWCVFRRAHQGIRSNWERLSRT
jgi:hypothetical protein